MFALVLYFLHCSVIVYSVSHYTMCVFQHWEVFKVITEVFILVPALVGLKGNLEMTLAARLSTAVRKSKGYVINYLMLSVVCA